MSAVSEALVLFSHVLTREKAASSVCLVVCFQQSMKHSLLSTFFPSMLGHTSDCPPTAPSDCLHYSHPSYCYWLAPLVTCTEHLLIGCAVLLIHSVLVIVWGFESNITQLQSYQISTVVTPPVYSIFIFKLCFQTIVLEHGNVISSTSSCRSIFSVRTSIHLGIDSMNSTSLVTGENYRSHSCMDWIASSLC